MRYDVLGGLRQLNIILSTSYIILILFTLINFASFKAFREILKASTETLRDEKLIKCNSFYVGSFAGTSEKKTDYVDSFSDKMPVFKVKI
jgi:hypothetical protein